MVGDIYTRVNTKHEWKRKLLIQRVYQEAQYMLHLIVVLRVMGQAPSVETRPLMQELLQ